MNKRQKKKRKKYLADRAYIAEKTMFIPRNVSEVRWCKIRRQKNEGGD